MVAKTYDTLFALNKQGKILIFDQEIYSNTVNGTCVINSSTGLQDGKKKVTATKVTKGKQKRTVLEQAESQADSNWNTKRNEGYKTYGDLVLYGQSMDIDIEPHMPPHEIYKRLGITYNTDTNWYPLPMLAEKWAEKKKHVKYPVIIQPKLNGVRCLCFWDKTSCEIVFATRGGKTYKLPFLSIQLKPFFAVNPKVILDGEIFCLGKRLQEISGAARNEKEKVDWLGYHVYDVISDKTQTERLADLRIYLMLLKTQFNAPDIHEVFTTHANTEEEVKYFHDQFVSEGYEGAIVRNPKGKYWISFRVSELLKVKEFIDEEFVIIGCKVDPDKTVGESFVFELENNTNDKTFYARPTGSIQDKEYWYANIDALVGAKATVRYQERTADDLPHQGHIRSDKTKCLTVEEVDPYK